MLPTSSAPGGAARASCVDSVRTPPCPDPLHTYLRRLAVGTASGTIVADTNPPPLTAPPPPFPQARLRRARMRGRCGTCSPPPSSTFCSSVCPSASGRAPRAPAPPSCSARWVEPMCLLKLAAAKLLSQPLPLELGCLWRCCLQAGLLPELPPGSAARAAFKSGQPCPPTTSRADYGASCLSRA